MLPKTPRVREIRGNWEVDPGYTPAFDKPYGMLTIYTNDKKDGYPVLREILPKDVKDELDASSAEGKISEPVWFACNPSYGISACTIHHFERVCNALMNYEGVERVVLSSFSRGPIKTELQLAYRMSRETKLAIKRFIERSGDGDDILAVNFPAIPTDCLDYGDRLLNMFSERVTRPDAFILQEFPDSGYANPVYIGYYSSYVCNSSFTGLYYANEKIREHFEPELQTYDPHVVQIPTE